MENNEGKRYYIDPASVPLKFPTHRHQKEFWENLGRVVATFGFLEEVLGKAIFSFTATRPLEPSELDDAYQKWLTTLKKALTDPLGKLIGNYQKAVNEHPHASVQDFDTLINDLREASKIRNVLCHGSWRSPDSQGASRLFYIDKSLNEFCTPVDCAFLVQVQTHVAQLSCAIINSVTQMGWDFPGSRNLNQTWRKD